MLFSGVWSFCDGNDVLSGRWWYTCIEVLSVACCVVFSRVMSSRECVVDKR